MKIRLYRSCTVRDKKNNYCLSSKSIDPLTNRQALEEIVSHELNASTGRGVFYSFSPDLTLVRAYHTRNPENIQICYVDVDLSNVQSSIKSLYPIYLRDYLMCLIANSSEVLSSGMALDPATKRAHSILGILNTSQRTVSGWAFSMREIVLQCDHLQLQLYKGCDNIAQDEMKVDAALKSYCIKIPDTDNINRFRHIIETSFKTANLKRKYILERVNGSEWYETA